MIFFEIFACRGKKGKKIVDISRRGWRSMFHVCPPRVVVNVVIVDLTIRNRSILIVVIDCVNYCPVGLACNSSSVAPMDTIVSRVEKATGTEKVDRLVRASEH